MGNVGNALRRNFGRILNLYLRHMKLIELLEAVKDERLPLPLIEKYRDEMVHLHTSMQIELADLEKSEAMYFVDDIHDDDESDIAIKRAWRATEKGQREILLNRYLKAVVKEIDSLKSRVYRLI